MPTEILRIYFPLFVEISRRTLDKSEFEEISNEIFDKLTVSDKTILIKEINKLRPKNLISQYI